MGEKVGFGAIVSYELTGGRIVARLSGAASMTEFPLDVVVVYGKDLTLDSVQMYYGSFVAPPLSEQEIKSMMEQRLPATSWTFGKDGDQYTVDFTDPPNGEGQGNTYKINPFTGTVYDAISGNPLRSLVNREAIDLWEISDGSKYQKELYKLLQPILDTEGFSRSARTGFPALPGMVICSVKSGKRAGNSRLKPMSLPASGKKFLIRINS